MPKRAEPRYIRFLERVKKIPGGCWEWTGKRDKDGYGKLSVPGSGGDEERAPRVAWEIFNSSIPAGMEVCHTCDNPGCVKPDHLWIGTHKDNMDDRDRKKRHHWGSKTPSSKLNEDIVYLIRAETGTCKELGQKYGVAPQTISRIKRRELWAHV